MTKLIGNLTSSYELNKNISNEGSLEGVISANTKVVGSVNTNQIIASLGLGNNINVNIQGSARGKSSYQIWLDEGNEGSKQDFLDSLQGTTNYEKLKNKPSIEMVELEGNKSFKELGLSEINNTEISNLL